MPHDGAHATLHEPANIEAQRTGHKPEASAFPKRALWPGPLERKVRRREHGPQVPRAIAGVRAPRPATAAQRRPSHGRRAKAVERRRTEQGTDRATYRRRRMPPAEAHAPLHEPANDKAQRTGHIE